MGKKHTSSLQLNSSKPILVAQIISRLWRTITKDMSIEHSKEIAVLGGNKLPVLSLGILLGLVPWENMSIV